MEKEEVNDDRTWLDLCLLVADDLSAIEEEIAGVRYGLWGPERAKKLEDLTRQALEIVRDIVASPYVETEEDTRDLPF